MIKRSAFVLATMTILSAGLASADSYDERHAGSKGYVTAYEEDGTTIIDVDSCPATKYSFDYVTCGRAFRERIKSMLCTKLGEGKHKWFYQVANSRKSPNTAYCK